MKLGKEAEVCVEWKTYHMLGATSLNDDQVIVIQILHYG